MPRSGAGHLAGPGFVVRGGPEYGSVGLGHGTHVVWVLTVTEHRTSDTCSLIAWTIDLLSNILWEGRLLQRPKQHKIINHKGNKTMHSPVLSESAILPPSRAIGNVLFPTYEVATSSLHSNYLFLLKEYCNIPLVDNHKYLNAKHLCCFSCYMWRMTGWMPETFFYLYSIKLYRCNFHFNFTQYNMILLSSFWHYS